MGGGLGAGKPPAGVHHPLELLPEDVWPLVAGKLEDSADILNLIQVVPGLEAWMEWKKRFWLFEQVIPHVARFLKRNELLCCRQVCKKWSDAVDNFLDNHPLLRPYSHGKPVTGQIWTYGGRPTRIHRMHKAFPLQPIRFETVEQITSFLQSMEGHPKWRSPIVNRGLLIEKPGSDGSLWNETLDVLRSCGEHIWFLTVSVSQATDPSVVCRCVGELLEHLPNLKSLKVDWAPGLRSSGRDPGIPQQELEQPAIPPKPLSREQFPPPLPHLETLWLFGDLPAVTEHALVTTYSHQLCRLSIGLLESPMPTRFPNLTELTLLRATPSWKQMSQFFQVLEAPLLSHLELSLYVPDGAPVTGAIFPWLGRYPLLRNLSLNRWSNVGVDEEATSTKLTTYSFPSVRYLRIDKSLLWANSDFLLCFPNLECLELGRTLPLPKEAALEPTLKIWEDGVRHLRMCECNVWELLPKLQLITVAYDPTTAVSPRNVEYFWEASPAQFKRVFLEQLRKNSAK